MFASAVCLRAWAEAVSPVTISENAQGYTLDNGVVRARVHKRSGDLISLQYQGLELMGSGSGHPYGYWSHAPVRGMPLTNGITLDPARNGGARGEVAIKGLYVPGSEPPRTAVDVEIRYALARGDSGLYTCSILTHPTNYPATGVGEARFGAKLNPAVFDYLTIDQHRRKLMPKPEDWDRGTELNFKEARRLTTGLYAGQVEHKYDYSAIQFLIPAYGWSSTRHRLSLWFINPSIEYLSGGPTKVELTGHLDNNEGAAPTLLNYWRGSHYGGAICAIGEGEHWTKVIGPFLIYCNAGRDADAMWQDALARAAREARHWPYDWVQGADYPSAKQRGNVQGRIAIVDPFDPEPAFRNMLVGLSAPDYSPPWPPRNSGAAFSPGGEDDAGTNAPVAVAPPADPRPGANANRNSGSRRSGAGGRGRGGFALPAAVDWQLDAKHYQFWVRADERGRFVIPNVRPGTYTLHAIADGILGEAIKTNVVVAAGRKSDLGELQWKPVRYGRALWEIGIPDRSAAEFRHGDHYWRWGLYREYTNDFPRDVNFVVGWSDWRTDWNYAQVPRGPDQGTTWSVIFDLADAPQGKTTLRLGIAGATLRQGIQVAVNGQPAGVTSPLPDTMTIRRDGIRGYWCERNVSFDAGLMKAGTNVLSLAIPGGQEFSGVQYDYLRLELDERRQ